MSPKTVADRKRPVFAMPLQLFPGFNKPQRIFLTMRAKINNLSITKKASLINLIPDPIDAPQKALLTFCKGLHRKLFAIERNRIELQNNRFASPDIP